MFNRELYNPLLSSDTEDGVEEKVSNDLLEGNTQNDTLITIEQKEVQSITQEKKRDRLIDIKKMLIKDSLLYSNNPDDENAYFDQYTRPLRKIECATFSLAALTFISGTSILISNSPNNHFTGLDENDNNLYGSILTGTGLLLFTMTCALVCSSKCIGKILEFAPHKNIFLPDDFNLNELNKLLISVEIDAVKTPTNTNELGKLSSVIDKALQILDHENDFDNYQLERGKILRSELGKIGFFKDGQKVIMEYAISNDSIIKKLMA